VWLRPASRAAVSASGLFRPTVVTRCVAAVEVQHTLTVAAGTDIAFAAAVTAPEKMELTGVRRECRMVVRAFEPDVVGFGDVSIAALTIVIASVTVQWEVNAVEAVVAVVVHLHYASTIGINRRNGDEWVTEPRVKATPSRVPSSTNGQHISRFRVLSTAVGV